ncbi:uncharacterized protein LOC119729924 [Patiria miniata]|uniref:Uncharacterized protein n=1 Tax=Patiria miniata TaxID=46514 RepID=A0A914A523_PATMI|nr:uncharacterized protein LOC119729924 [Patiria miniata]
MYLAAKKYTDEERIKVSSTTKQKCYLFVVMLLFVSYPGLSGVIFTLLPSGCDLFYLDENETYNSTRLRSDYFIDCQDEQHVHFNHAAEASLCYVVGFPSLLFVFLWRSNRQDKRKNSQEQPLVESSVNDPSYYSVNNPTMSTVNEDDSTINQPHINLLNPIQQSQVDISWKSFLSGNYKAEFWYWEVVELSRKIIQTLFVLLYGPDDHFTMFATIAISVGFLLLHAYVRPTKDATDNRLQMCSLATIFLNLLAASLLLSRTGGSTGRTEVLAAILVLMNFSIIVFVIGSLSWMVMKSLWRSGCCGSMATCIAKACCWFCRHESLAREGRGTRLVMTSVRDLSLDADEDYLERPYDDIISERDHVVE